MKIYHPKEFKTIHGLSVVVGRPNASRPEQRPEDQVWQEEILGWLSCFASNEYFESQRKKLGSIRLRPEEVAGASSSVNFPVGFQVCIFLAEQMKAELTNSLFAQVGGRKERESKGTT